MYFVLIVGALDLMRWILCASGSLMTLKLQASERKIVHQESRRHF